MSYCPVCSACGEEGCCPPTVCEFHKDGLYCNSYLKDLKFAYLLLKELDTSSIPDEKFDEIYKLVYESIL